MVGADTRFLHGIGGTLGGGMMTAAAIAGEPVSALRPPATCPTCGDPSRSSTCRERGTRPA